MKSAFQFATFAMLCIFPLLIVIGAALGGDIRKLIITRLGLNPQAAKDVNGLIGSGHQALASLTVLSTVFLVLSAIAIASTLQEWYQKVYDQPPSRDWMRQLVNRLIWVAGLLAYILLQALVGRQIGPAGGHVLIFAAEFGISVVFWWWTLDMLLLGKISWRALFPAGLATAACFTGLSVFSSLFFSSSLISDEKSYGPVGVVLALLSYFIAIAVVVHLGAVIGRMWNERHASPERPAAHPAAQPGA
jgi:membrane protein